MSRKNSMKVKISGHETLLINMKAIGKAVPDVLIPAAFEAAQIIRDEADRMAGSDVNTYELNPKTKYRRAEVFIGPKSERWYWSFRETGAMPHEIRPKVKKGLKALKLADGVFARYLTGENQHPGLTPRPFLRPAADGKVDEAVMAAFRVVSREIDKHAEKPE